MIVKNFRLIIDFSRRTFMVNQCLHYIEALNDALITVERVDALNDHFPLLLKAVILLAYFTFAGRLVMDGDLTIGQFLTNLSVCTDMCISWQTVYHELMTMHKVFPPLVAVTRYLNMPIDLSRRRILTNLCREANAKERVLARQALQDAAKRNDPALQGILYASDAIPLKFEDVIFTYTSSSHVSVTQSIRKLTHSWSFNDATTRASGGMRAAFQSGTEVQNKSDCPAAVAELLCHAAAIVFLCDVAGES